MEMNINISKLQLLEIYNVYFNVYYPIKKFVSKKQFISIIENMKIGKKFFPIPIYFNLKNINLKIKIFKVYYKKKYVCDLNISKIYTFNYTEKIEIGKKFFLTDDITHPGYNKFLKEGNYFLDCKIVNFNKNKLYVFYSKPTEIKNFIKLKKIKSIAGFHTRNVPHKAHEWIQRYGILKTKNLLIQPLIGQYRRGEYKENIIIKSNKLLVDKIYKNKAIFSVLSTFPRYGGPREALFHAIIRRNYGCTHFLVGRDHAGVKEFYSKFASQRICKKNEDKLGIKILIFNEPYLCTKCNKILNYNCNKCGSKYKTYISGTKIRNLIIKNKKIPKTFMRKLISNNLNKNSIIN